MQANLAALYRGFELKLVIIDILRWEQHGRVQSIVSLNIISDILIFFISISNYLQLLVSDAIE